MNAALTARIAALNAAVALHAAPSPRVGTAAREILDTAQLFEQYLAGFPAPRPDPLALDEHVRALQEWTAAQLLLRSAPIAAPGRGAAQERADPVRELPLQAPR